MAASRDSGAQALLATENAAYAQNRHAAGRSVRQVPTGNRRGHAQRRNNASAPHWKITASG